MNDRANPPPGEPDGTAPPPAEPAPETGAAAQDAEAKPDDFFERL